MNTFSRRLGVTVVVLTLVPCAISQATPLKIDVEKRVDSILGKMTLEEKIQIIGGINDFFTRPIPRLAMRALKMCTNSSKGGCSIRLCEIGYS